MAFEAGMPSADKMRSACSFTSGSILAYKFADFDIVMNSFHSDMDLVRLHHITLYAQEQCFFKNIYRKFVPLF